MINALSIGFPQQIVYRPAEGAGLLCGAAPMKKAGAFGWAVNDAGSSAQTLEF